MDIFSPYRDHLLVRVNVDDAHRTASGIFIPEWQRGDYDPTRAEVLAAPQGLSQAGLDFPGLDGQSYCYADLQDIPQPGDVVYLRYNSLRPDTEIPGQAGVFIVALSQVVATASPNGLRPFGGLLLCEEVYGDDVRQRADGVRERVKLNPDRQQYKIGDVTVHWKENIHLSPGIVTEVNPLPIPFTLRILHAGQPLCGQEDVVVEGDTILAHRMLFAYHPVKQKDDEEAGERRMWQPPRIVIEGRKYAYVPRQGVLGKAERPQPHCLPLHHPAYNA